MPTPLNSFSIQQSLSQSGKVIYNLRGSSTNYAAPSASPWTGFFPTGWATNSTIPGTETGWSAAIKTCYLTTNAYGFLRNAGGQVTSTDNITMMCRVYITQFRTGSVEQWLFYNGDSTANGYGVRYDGSATNNQRFTVVLGGIIAVKAGPAALSLNTWYHVALRRSGGVWTLWVDGTSYAVNSTNPNTPTLEIYILGYTSGTTQYMIGNLTDFVFYNGAFADTEIQRYATAPFI
jgi:hypothetical protein